MGGWGGRARARLAATGWDPPSFYTGVEVAFPGVAGQLDINRKKTTASEVSKIPLWQCMNSSTTILISFGLMADARPPSNARPN